MLTFDVEDRALAHRLRDEPQATPSPVVVVTAIIGVNFKAVLA